ncbi:MAG: EAL domain-containing protein [Nitriliruptoraceae bacterium]
MLTAAAITLALATPGGVIGSLVAASAGAAIAVTAAIAAKRAHRVIRPSWVLLSLGVGIAVTSDIILTLWRLAGPQPPPFPGPAHVLYLAGGIATAAGIASLVQSSDRARALVVDVAIVTVCVGALVWPTFVQPLWGWSDETFARIYLTSYAAVHMAILFAVVRLILNRKPRHTGHRLVIAGGAMHGLTATVAAALVAADRYVVGGLQEIGWLTAHGLIAMALWHPSAREAIVGRRRWTDRTTPTRALALFGITLLLPVAIGLRAYEDREIVLAGVTALVLATMSARMWMLLRQISEAHDDALASQSQRDHRRFSALVRHTTDILLVVDPIGEVTYANPAATSLYGADPTGWTTRQIIDFLHPDDRSRVVTSILTYVDKGDTTEPIRLHARLAAREGREQFIDLVVADLSDDPDVGGVVITIQDTTERTELERRLRHLALHDPLTGLGNRELFRDRLEHALARIRRTGAQLAVFMCDLDDFKDVNDTLGHAVGDHLLSQVATLLSGVTRAGDTVARLGGDEFAVLFEDVESTRDTITLARRALDALRDPIRIGNHDLRVGMSIGIAIDGGQRSAEELLRDADIALYEAKAQGKRRWSVHRRAMTVRNQDRLRIADDLVLALADQQLEIAYQPIHDLISGTLVGVEALARWHHPERGDIPPTEFIPIAEQSGLINAVGEFVLSQALTTLRRCIDAQPGLRLQMGINVSPRELREPALVDRIIKQLRNFGIDANTLILEITESGMLDDTATTLGVMDQLRQQGVKFAVDDFGTGYSSLSYLRRLPVDIVKIDQSFVEELDDDDASASELVRAIVELGRTLGLDTCAEGVETDAQRRALIAIGCPFAQGFLFAHPESADALVERIMDPSTSLVLDSARPALPPVATATSASPDPATTGLAADIEQAVTHDRRRTDGN